MGQFAWMLFWFILALILGTLSGLVFLFALSAIGQGVAFGMSDSYETADVWGAVLGGIGFVVGFLAAFLFIASRGWIRVMRSQSRKAAPPTSYRRRPQQTRYLKH